jgi:transposase
MPSQTELSALMIGSDSVLVQIDNLPPYSPDLNPIEMAFSKLKAHLRRAGARTFDQMFDALAEVCDLSTPQESWNYFCEAGYGSS